MSGAYVASAADHPKVAIMFLHDDVLEHMLNIFLTSRGVALRHNLVV